MATQEKIAEVRKKQQEDLAWPYLHDEHGNVFLCPLCYCQRALAYAQLLAQEAEVHSQKRAVDVTERDLAAGVPPYPTTLIEANGRNDGERDGYRWLYGAMRELIGFSAYPVRVCAGMHTVRQVVE